MNAKERYYWDVTGHLVVRDVLSQEELDAVNNVLDYVIGTGIVHQSEDNHGAADSTFLRGDWFALGTRDEFVRVAPAVLRSRSRFAGASGCCEVFECDVWEGFQVGPRSPI